MYEKTWKCVVSLTFVFPHPPEDSNIIWLIPAFFFVCEGSLVIQQHGLTSKCY